MEQGHNFKNMDQIRFCPKQKLQGFENRATLMMGKFQVVACIFKKNLNLQKGLQTSLVESDL